MAGHTLVGPHKDDFVIYSINGQDRDLMKYGSRGEQRLAVLFAKLGIMQYLEDKIKAKPILLLDDIFSELDETHRQEVLKMTEVRQTILTTADEEVLKMVDGAEVVRVA
jgi:DNA replication and repair protein RecF